MLLRAEIEGEDFLLGGRGLDLSVEFGIFCSASKFDLFHLFGSRKVTECLKTTFLDIHSDKHLAVLCHSV